MCSRSQHLWAVARAGVSSGDTAVSESVLLLEVGCHQYSPKWPPKTHWFITLLQEFGGSLLCSVVSSLSGVSRHLFTSPQQVCQTTVKHRCTLCKIYSQITYLRCILNITKCLSTLETPPWNNSLCIWKVFGVAYNKLQESALVSCPSYGAAETWQRVLSQPLRDPRLSMDWHSRRKSSAVKEKMHWCSKLAISISYRRPTATEC